MTDHVCWPWKVTDHVCWPWKVTDHVCWPWKVTDHVCWPWKVTDRVVGGKYMVASVWILTYEINEYDQDGEYFLAVFKEKPTKEVLETFVVKDATRHAIIEHLLETGGGRIDYEFIWYFLREHKL